MTSPAGGPKLKMAALLGGGGLLEEGARGVLQAGLSLGKALAVENRVAAPVALEDVLRPRMLFSGATSRRHPYLCRRSIGRIGTRGVSPEIAGRPISG